VAQEYQFGDFILDQGRYRLQRGERVVRLEKRPMELLILLIERRGQLVSREEIAERLWGKDVFLDADHSINTAIRKIRQALRDDPEKPLFVETVVGKGYYFAAPVSCSNSNRDPQVHPIQSAPLIDSLSADPSTEKRSTSRRLWMLLAATALLALLASAVVFHRGRRVYRTDQVGIKSIAVLPLKNLSGDPSQEYLADGMTEELIGRLARIHDLRVISRTSVMRFKDALLSVPEIAKTLNVDAIVEGSVVREGNRIRVHAQLLRGASDEHLWAQEYDRDLRDVLALQSDVAQDVADKVEVAVTGKERARLIAARPVSPEVYESYLKGRRLVDGNSKADIEGSIAYFEEASRRDPTFAPAYVGLAEAYDRLGYIFVGVRPGDVHPKAMNAAEKAVQLDPELAEAHVMLADAYQFQWQWKDAEAEYKRALELKPSDADAHIGYASWLLCQGRVEEALAWSRSAAELEPLDSDATVSWILFNARHYDEAMREVRSVLAVHPDSAMAHWVLGFVLIAKAQYEEAISVLEKAVSMTNRSPGTIGLLATAYAHAGRGSEALRLLEELTRRRQSGYVPAAAFIFPYLALSDYDQAFSWCEQAYEEQSNVLQLVKVLPLFDPVRGDPRFIDLQRRVGLN